MTAMSAAVDCNADCSLMPFMIDLLTVPHMEIQPDLGDLHALFEVHWSRDRVDGVGHECGAVAELIIVVLYRKRPMAGECPVNPATHDPAQALVQTLEAEGNVGEGAGYIILVSGP